MFRLRLIGSATLFLAFFSLLGDAQQQITTATVHLRVVDPLGEDVSGVRVAAFSSLDESDVDLASRFQDSVAANIPFGTYRLRTYATGFRSAERDVPVYGVDTWIVVSLEPGGEGSPARFRVTGSVRNVKDKDVPIWVRLSGTQSALIVDARASNSGDFSLAGLTLGSYVMVVTQSNRVLDVRTIKVPVREPIVIDVGQP